MALEDEGKEASRGRGFCPVRRCRERRERLVPEGGPSQGYFGALNSLNRFWGVLYIRSFGLWKEDFDSQM